MSKDIKVLVLEKERIEIKVSLLLDQRDLFRESIVSVCLSRSLNSDWLTQNTEFGPLNHPRR